MKLLNALLDALIDAFPYVASPAVGMRLISAVFPGAAVPAALIFIVSTGAFFAKYFWAESDQPKIIYLLLLVAIGLTLGCS
ncbi:MAG: hypothetical protein KME19_08945 [Microcoleus vaginatus WJT46-NPBG5]|jgi:hypothetical protein|nr:hypothetical protein [Microcoleus vaginatus WJT46-NPBG5]MBW4680227.1 hypothetical protein [Microcoleus vaginatus WJT46-NPBG5]